MCKHKKEKRLGKGIQSGMLMQQKIFKLLHLGGWQERIEFRQATMMCLEFVFAVISMLPQAPWIRVAG